MMNINVNNPREVYLAGITVLNEALGPVGFASFMQQVDGGSGDYTKEKQSMPDMSIGEIMAGIEKMRAEYDKHKQNQTADN